MTDNDNPLRPDNVANAQKRKKKSEEQALEQIVVDIRSDANATKNEKRIASAIIALSEL